MNNTEKGKSFENYVASIYQGLGYKVDTNLSMAFKQIDIVAEKYTGEAGIIKLAIECKYLGQEGRSVKNTDIHSFNDVIANLIRTEKVTKGVLVTNGTFSQPAKNAAAHGGLVQLLTIKQLEGSFFELTNSYLAFKEKYEKRRIFHNYVPLKGVEESSVSSKQTPIEDIETHIVNYVSQPKNHFLTILGDYGAGKTTLLERIKYKFVQKYLHEESAIKPILILLKDFQKYKSLDNLLYHSIVKEFNREIPFNLFKNAVNEGNILLLLDAFDEMSQQIDDKKRKENFFLLSELLPANAILTCRPSYFGSYKEYNAYITEIRKFNAPGHLNLSNQKSRKINPGMMVYVSLGHHLHREMVGYEPAKSMEFVTIRLATFDESQIDSYLQKFNSKFLEKYGKDWTFIKKAVTDTYGLEELLKRPIHLEIIVTTLLFEKFDIKKHLVNTGPAMLYDYYTTNHLERDWHKGESRQLISHEDRKIFATAVAVSMFLENKSSVTYDDIRRIVIEQYANTEFASDLPAIPIQYLVSDIQTCTFLTVSLSEESFEFAHKSFMEFFVSKFIVELILQHRPNAVLDCLLSEDIVYFLSSFCNVLEDLKKSVLSWHKQLNNQKNASSVHLRKNICNILLSSNKILKNTSFDDASIMSLLLKGIQFDQCSFRNATFQEVTVTGVRFTQSGESAIAIKGSGFEDCSMDGKNLTLQLADSLLSGMTFTWDEMSLWSMDSTVSNSQFTLRSIRFSGDLRLDGCTFNDCHINLSEDDYGISGVHLTDSHFNRCTLSTPLQSDKKYFLTNPTFIKASFNGITFSDNDYDDEKFRDCRGQIFIHEFVKTPRNSKLERFEKFRLDYFKYSMAKEAEEGHRAGPLSNKTLKQAEKPEDNLHFDNYYFIDKRLLVIYEPAWRIFRSGILQHMDQLHERPNWIREFVKQHI